MCVCVPIQAYICILVCYLVLANGQGHARGYQCVINFDKQTGVSLECSTVRQTEFSAETLGDTGEEQLTVSVIVSATTDIKMRVSPVWVLFQYSSYALMRV